MNRLAKQLLFGLVFLVIVGVPAWFVYRVLVPAPTCTDRIQNGQEEGVDCGVLACGVACAPEVQPLEEVAPVIIKTGPTSADIIAHLENPNSIYGAARVDYTLTVTDAAGTQLASRTGFTYVNPMQPRYLLFPLMNLPSIPASAQLQFTPAEVQWGTLAVAAASNVQFATLNDQFTQTDTSAQYTAIIANRSTFTFDAVDVTILLFDESGAIVGANSTVLRTLVPDEQRGLTLTWPFAVPSAVRAQAFVSTNLFANTNFIRTYGSPEQLQE